MCTALTMKTQDHYFGRTLDLERHYQEQVTVVPRRFPFSFRRMGEMRQHYALIGMATIVDGQPLYYDATNEKGLSMAGLNFPVSAVYHDYAPGKDNVASFELIPWVLGQCESVAQARVLLGKLNVLREDFSDALPCTPLHWMLADEKECIVVESMADGLHIHDDPHGVMTNEPPFLQQVENFMQSTALPGAFSSQARFIRAATVREVSVCAEDEAQSVSQFFHILEAVQMPRGCVQRNGGQQITVYTSCCNAAKGIYYYTTYENPGLTAVDMHKCELGGDQLYAYPMKTALHIAWEN